MKIKKHLIIRCVKRLLLASALFWVFSEVDAAQVDHLMRQANPWVLLGAVTSFWIAQAVSGLRMRYYFASVNVKLSRKFSIALYFVSSFYNFLLPGGIGGDTYKVYVLSRMKQLRLSDGARVAFSERASGLFILGLFCSCLVVYTQIYQRFPYGFVLLVVAVFL